MKQLRDQAWSTSIVEVLKERQWPPGGPSALRACNRHRNFVHMMSPYCGPIIASMQFLDKKMGRQDVAQLHKPPDSYGKVNCNLGRAMQTNARAFKDIVARHQCKLGVEIAARLIDCAGPIEFHSKHILAALRGV